MTPDEKTIEEIKQQVAPRDLNAIEIEQDGDEPRVLLCVSPGRVEWMKYLNDLTSTEDIGKKLNAHENFILAHAKWPSRDEVKKLLTDKPGYLTAITDQLSMIVGAGAKVRAKKL